MLAKTVTEAARFVAERGVLKEGAPILLKLVRLRSEGGLTAGGGGKRILKGRQVASGTISLAFD
jgi:hypothetical protein